MPNFVEIGHFNGFLKRPHLPFWIFLNVKFLTADGVRRLLLHHHIKFHGDLSMHCGNIVFFYFQDGSRACHLDFQISRYSSQQSI